MFTTGDLLLTEDEEDDEEVEVEVALAVLLVTSEVPVAVPEGLTTDIGM